MVLFAIIPCERVPAEDRLSKLDICQVMIRMVGILPSVA